MVMDSTVPSFCSTRRVWARSRSPRAGAEGVGAGAGVGTAGSVGTSGFAAVPSPRAARERSTTARLRASPVRKGERRERHAFGFRKFNTSFIHIRAGREMGGLEIPGTL